MKAKEIWYFLENNVEIGSAVLERWSLFLRYFILVVSKEMDRFTLHFYKQFEYLKRL